jgi:hypothetical protein
VTVISTFPCSALETGQFSFARSQASWKAASSILGTFPMTSSADFVIPVPGTKVTVAETARLSGAFPARLSRPRAPSRSTPHGRPR